MAAILLTIIYLLYLSLICQPLIIYDSLGYIHNGQYILEHGFIPFLKLELQREPLYLLMVSWALHLGKTFSVDGLWVLRLFQLSMLVITQILSFFILKGLNVRPWIRNCALIYTGCSPVLVNSTIWVYSEAATLAFVAAIIWAAAHAWHGVINNVSEKKQTINGLVFGTALALIVFVKGIFEALSPALILIFLLLTLAGRLRPDIQKKALLLLVCTAAAFYIPITAYKYTNKILNGNFAFTNRGAWALYGISARRVDPLTPKRLQAGLVYMVNPHFCTQLMDQNDCDFWSYKISDTYAYAKLNELSQKGSTPKETSQTMLRLAFEKIISHPLQYTFLTFLEGFKIFFWETAKAGQTAYPDWLDRIYNIKWFEPVLVVISSGASLGALILLFWATIKDRRKFYNPQSAYAQALIFFILVFLLLYAGAHSFFFVLQRYMIPIAPLWIIAIAYAVDHCLLKQKNRT